MTSFLIVKKALCRSAIILMICIMAFVMTTLPSNAASQSERVQLDDHKRNSNITVSAKYGIGTLKLDPKVSTSGCNISITKITKCSGLAKTHAFKK